MISLQSAKYHYSCYLSHPTGNFLFLLALEPSEVTGEGDNNDTIVSYWGLGAEPANPKEKRHRVNY